MWCAVLLAFREVLWRELEVSMSLLFLLAVGVMGQLKAASYNDETGYVVEKGLEFRSWRWCW